MRTTALFSALSVAILAMVAYRFSVSDICGWYLKDGSPQIDVIDDRKAACQLSGNVPHCSCSYAAVENMNLNSMRSILSELVQTPFFRYFKTVRGRVDRLSFSSPCPHALVSRSDGSLTHSLTRSLVDSREPHRISCASARSGRTTACAR